MLFSFDFSPIELHVSVDRTCRVVFFWTHSSIRFTQTAPFFAVYALCHSKWYDELDSFFFSYSLWISTMMSVVRLTATDSLFEVLVCLIHKSSSYA